MTITLSEVRGGFNTSTINSNFEKIEEALNSNVLSVKEGSNQMEQDLDMNSNRLINLPAPINPTEPLRLEDLKTLEGDVSGIVPTVIRHTGDGVTFDFDSGTKVVAGPFSTKVYLNGIRLFPEVDYTTIGTKVRFINYVPTSTDKVDIYSYAPLEVIGPVGPTGPQGQEGERGPSPQYEWEGTRIRFIQPDGTWGPYVDLVGEIGPVGPQGPQGNVGPQGDSVAIDAIGNFADRSTYDNSPAKFVFFAKDYVFGVTQAGELEVVSDGVTSQYTLPFEAAGPAEIVLYYGNSYQRIATYSVTNLTNLVLFNVPEAGVRIVARRQVVPNSVGALFIKLSNTSGDWSQPYPFGQGPQGIEGPQGPIGPVGPQGPRGPEGPQGQPGQTGPQGPIGPQGPEGPRGPMGPQGPEGDKGPQGDQGQRGSREWYIETTGTSWSQALIDAINPNPVIYDVGIQYNKSQGYSESRVYRGSGVWEQVELVQGFTIKVMNGVSATKLNIGSATVLSSTTFGGTDTPLNQARSFSVRLGVISTPFATSAMVSLEDLQVLLYAFSPSFQPTVQMTWSIRVNGSVVYESSRRAFVTADNTTYYGFSGGTWAFTIPSPREGNTIEVFLNGYVTSPGTNFKLSRVTTTGSQFSVVSLKA
ncbi:tail fiber protein [Vibrio phage JSF23]|jgi:hypothetical protein|uniref:Tail fiber protein n=1 Tax=Vibrio phage ICP2_2011_A TaxID=1529057 RepID=A0A076GB71_9CAUD|nr:hypothetical protein ICP22011A_0025 [Vibrio phage ICP2_2011_A]ASV43722.1 tail fiber protein [Vibrio phage JSF23]